MRNFEYALPDKIKDAFEYLDEQGTQLKGGGIDLLDLLKEDLITPKRLVNLSRINELRKIKFESERGLIIGSGITLADLAKENKLEDSFKALAQAAGEAATPQIRNSATLGGNLCQRPRCWYFRSKDFFCSRKNGDTCFALDGENQYHAIFGNDDGCAIVHPSATAVALMALNARLKIVSQNDEKEIGTEEFFITPDEDITRENILQSNEIITEIIIPNEMKQYKSFYIKQKEKQAFDWPIADVAVALKIEGNICNDARIVLGSAAPVPLRVKDAESVLVGSAITKELVRKAADKALERATPLSENGYKVKVFKAVIYRTICKAVGLDPFV
jgi:xanthine dehydrogenase YagS FAD-binding subunit